MRAHTITTTNRSKLSAGQRAAIVLLAIGALVIPATANASPADSSGFSKGDPTYSSVNAITGERASSPAPSTDAGSSYSSLSSIAGPPASEPTLVSGQPDPRADHRSGYSSLNSIAGAPASEPTLVSGGPGDPADGFDWGSAAVGAGSVLAMGALAGAALLTVRRRTAQPSVSTS